MQKVSPCIKSGSYRCPDVYSDRQPAWLEWREYAESSTWDRKDKEEDPEAEEFSQLVISLDEYIMKIVASAVR